MIQSEVELLERFRAIDRRTWAQVGAVAAVSTAAMLPVAWLAVKRLVPDRNIVFARWGFSHVAMAVGLLLLAQYAAYLVVPSERSLLGDLAISGSDRIRASFLVDQTELILGRDRNELWIYASTKKFGNFSTSRSRKCRHD